jgi:hypothetical protein
LNEQIMQEVARIKAVLFVKAPDEVMMQRLLERGKTSGRADDNPQSIHKRWVARSSGATHALGGVCVALCRGAKDHPCSRPPGQMQRVQLSTPWSIGTSGAVCDAAQLALSLDACVCVRVCVSRLKVYKDSTMPIIEYFRWQNKVFEVNGFRPVGQSCGSHHHHTQHMVTLASCRRPPYATPQHHHHHHQQQQNNKNNSHSPSHETLTPTISRL